jgi:hypothetical protein
MTMRGTLLILLTALMALAGYAPAEAKDEPKEDADPYILFRIAGRKWLLKRTPKPGAIGNNTVNYQQFEVINCHETKADVIQTPFDEAKQAQPDREVAMAVEFKAENFMFKDPPGFKKGKVEDVKTDAGTFKCTVWASHGGADGDSYQWRSNDFPGLVVKQDDQYSTRLLLEFDWVEGDPGYKADKKKKTKPEPDKIDPKRLFSSKGAVWIHRTDITRGERGTKTIEVVQTEVKKVKDTECEIEITRLTQLLEKLKGEEPETRVIKFDDTFGENLKPVERATLDRTEKRITKVGLFECTVYKFKDEEGREGSAWYADNWPGLLLKREVKGENYKSVTEIIKFDE